MDNCCFFQKKIITMKYIYSLLFLNLFSASVFACSCAWTGSSTTDRYLISDFVGEVQVAKLANIQTSRRIYVAELKGIRIYKGELPASIRVAGTASGENYSASCEVSLKENEKYLLYLNKNSDGEYYLNTCSFPLQLESSEGKIKVDKKSLKEKREQLKVLHTLIPDLNTDVLVKAKGDSLEMKLNKIEFQGTAADTGYYLVRLDSAIKVQNVEALKELGKGIDQKIITILFEDVKWESHSGMFVRKRKPETAYTFVGVAYDERSGEWTVL